MQRMFPPYDWSQREKCERIYRAQARRDMWNRFIEIIICGTLGLPIAYLLACWLSS